MIANNKNRSRPGSYNKSEKFRSVLTERTYSGFEIENETHKKEPGYNVRLNQIPEAAKAINNRPYSGMFAKDKNRFKVFKSQKIDKKNHDYSTTPQYHILRSLEELKKVFSSAERLMMGELDPAAPLETIPTGINLPNHATGKI